MLGLTAKLCSPLCRLESFGRVRDSGFKLPSCQDGLCTANRNTERRLRPHSSRLGALPQIMVRKLGHELGDVLESVSETTECGSLTIAALFAKGRPGANLLVRQRVGPSRLARTGSLKRNRALRFSALQARSSAGAVRYDMSGLKPCSAAATAHHTAVSPSVSSRSPP